MDAVIVTQQYSHLLPNLLFLLMVDVNRLVSCPVSCPVSLLLGVF
jgi:hypothetical protein